MIKIVLTGPESCGKTTLARQLAAHFDVPLAEEYVREFFEKKGTPDVSGQAPQYQEADLKEIAIGQVNAELNAQKAFNQRFNHSKNIAKPQLLICDTDVLTIKIWSEEKYGRCDEWIIGQFETPDSKPFPQMINAKGQMLQVPYFEVQNAKKPKVKSQILYLLCSPEGIAWEADPLRENPHDRDRLFTIYEENLIFHQKSYQILRGPISERLATACALIHRQLALMPPF
jgi:nicotinamide riboside kinase